MDRNSNLGPNPGPAISQNFPPSVSGTSTTSNDCATLISPRKDVELPLEAAKLVAEGSPPHQRTLERLAASNINGPRRIIYNFTPQWFVVTMGTGIAAIILHQLPYNAEWLYWLSVIVFAFNVLLFTTFCVLTLLRYLLYPEIWPIMLSHPQQPLFMGCFPIALATIINMMVLVCVPAWGDWVITWAWAFWWIGAVISFVVCYYVNFNMMRKRTDALSSMTAVWLLPSISPIVASAAGGNVAQKLSPEHAVWTLIVSWTLWGTGVPLALMVLTMYWQRLSLHNIPSPEAILSVFMPLGPLGQGGHAIQQLGLVALSVFPQTSTLPGAKMAGEIVYVMGWLTGLVMWSFACAWLVFALLSVASVRKFPFNMGWWALTFPTGVFTLSTIQLANDTPSRVFKVLGMIFGTCNILLWLLCAYFTFWRAGNGELFNMKVKKKGNDEENGKARVASDRQV